MDDAMKFGLLMESAQVHQKLAEDQLQKLKAHTQDLDDVVRTEIRRTLIDELQSVTAETERAVRALRRMQQAAAVRGLIWNVGIAGLCAALPGAVYWAVPSPSDISALRGQRDALAQSIARLERQGGRVDWRSCGDARRLCVRIDRQAAIYGENADYYIVKGY